jgi:hypothetical protein
MIKSGHPVDRLISLQQIAFEADCAGNHRRFGNAVLLMADTEREIGNHSEAAAYADTAAAAFVRGEDADLDGALSAHSTLAKEWRTLESPNLAFAALQEVVRLRVAASGKAAGVASGLVGPELQAVLRLAGSFTATYRSTFLTGTFNTEDPQYPVPHLAFNSPRPSKDASEGLMNSLDGLLEAPVAMTGGSVPTTLLYLQYLYVDLSSRRLNLDKVGRKHADSQRQRLGKVRFTIGLGIRPDHVKSLGRGDTTIEEVIQE